MDDWHNITVVGADYEHEISPSTGKERHRPISFGCYELPWVNGPPPNKTIKDFVLENPMEKIPKAVHQKTMDDVWKIVNQAVNMKAKYGHSDVGDVLVLLAQSKISIDEAIEEIEFLIEDYGGE